MVMSPHNPLESVFFLATYLNAQDAKQIASPFASAEKVPWVDITNAEGFNWSEAVKKLKDETAVIDKVLRNKSVYRTKALILGNLIIGSGATYPYHGHASPEFYYILSGEGELSVDGVTSRVYPGVTVYHKPYADHRMVTIGNEPLRTIWAQWAPNGDRKVLGKGYAMSAQIPKFPASAELNRNSKFLKGERPAELVPGRLASPVFDPVPGTYVDELSQKYKVARTKEHASTSEDYTFPQFNSSTEKPWLNLTTTQDIIWRELRNVIPNQIARLNQIMLVKTTFSTKDIFSGHFMFGPGATYPKHSRSAPMLFHILGGTASWTVGGKTIDAGPGTIVFAAPGVEQSLTVTSQEPLRALWIQWAPNGDMSYMGRDYFFLEPVIPQPRSASIAKDIKMFR